MTSGSVSTGATYSGTVDLTNGAVSGTWVEGAYGLSGVFSGNGSWGNLTGNGGAIPIFIDVGTFILSDVIPGIDIVNISAGATAVQNLTTAIASYAANITNYGTLVINAHPTTASTITGSSGIDIITGSSADDILDGGAGDDILTGGDGSDTYYIDNTGDSVTETANVSGSATLGFRLALDLSGNIDKVIASISYTLGDKLENLDLATGGGNLTGTGNALDNVLTGNEGNNTLTGGAGIDIIDGGAGIDIASYVGNRASFTLAQSGTGFTVTDSTGAEGTDTVTNIERLAFADTNVALDVTDGNAGTTAKILGAVFGTSSLSNTTYVGIGLTYLDGGMSYQNLMQLAIDAYLGAGANHVSVVNLLYTNVVGVAPSAADRDYFVGLLDTGAYTVASLGVMAANHSLNTANINLTGLAQTGIEFI